MKSKESKLMKNAKLVLVACLVVFAGYKLLSPQSVSPGKWEELTSVYNEAAGYGLANILAEKVPGGKILVIVPQDGDPAKQRRLEYLNGFRQGVKEKALNVVEADYAPELVNLPPMPPPPPGVPPQPVPINPALKGVDDIIARQGSGCAVIVSFVGLPRNLSSGTFNPGVAMSANKVAIIDDETLPGDVLSAVKKGLVMVLIRKNPDAASKVIRSSSREKLFAAKWMVIDSTNIDEMITNSR
jgi:hypothetical protein